MKLLTTKNPTLRRSSPAFAGVTARQEPSDFGRFAPIYLYSKDAGPLPSQERRGNNLMSKVNLMYLDTLTN